MSERYKFLRTMYGGSTTNSTKHIGISMSALMLLGCSGWWWSFLPNFIEATIELIGMLMAYIGITSTGLFSHSAPRWPWPLMIGDDSYPVIEDEES